MLVIRMQRTGRSGHAQFRVVVQDARRTPTSGNVVARLGHFDPHTKQTVIDKDKAAFYLEHGAQPSPRVARLLKAEGVKLPAWVAAEAKKSGAVRNPDKFGKKEPAAAVATDEAEVKPAADEPVAAEADTEEPEVAETAVTEPQAEADAPAEEPAEVANEAKAEESADETPTES
jgi:small subunit ribosomal protein S16